jgi:hypothetical protein
VCQVSRSRAALRLPGKGRVPAMLNLQKMKIEYCTSQLENSFKLNYGEMERDLGNLLVLWSHMVLENIANSDALYHNVDHTVLVAMAGQAILQGQRLSGGGVTPLDWVHFMLAVLCHDIGYVKGTCKADRGGLIATGVGGSTDTVRFEGTDAALAPYHVDRGKLFVRERFGRATLADGLLDIELIASYIEMTRFPVPDDQSYHDTEGFGGLVRAADFIGQLADPYRMQKCAALFYEFEELGLNQQLGYETPGDLRDNNAKFYWEVASPYVQDALRYLHATQTGKQWIANLHANVFGSEHGCCIWPYKGP